MLIRNIFVAVFAVMLCAAGNTTVTVGNNSYRTTEAQAAKISLDLATAKAQNQGPAGVDEISKYAALGKTIGVGMASTAHELGVAVNDFARTPVGMITMAIIVVKFLGDPMLHVGFGIIWFVVTFSTWFYVFRRTTIIRSVSIYRNERNKKVKEIQYWGAGKGDEKLCWMMVLAALTIVGISILFS